MTEESGQFFRAIAAGVEFQKIGSNRCELLSQTGTPGVERVLADVATREAEVRDKCLARLRITNGRQSAWRRLDLAGVIDGDAHEVMTKRHRPKLFAIHLEEEIGEHQDQDSSLRHMENRVESRRGIATPVAGLGSQKIGQQTQSVLPAFARLEELLHTVAA